MFQRQAKGAFKTSGSEQWPAKLCQWLSAMLVSTCLRAITLPLLGKGPIQDSWRRYHPAVKPSR